MVAPSDSTSSVDVVPMQSPVLSPADAHYHRHLPHTTSHAPPRSSLSNPRPSTSHERPSLSSPPRPSTAKVRKSEQFDRRYDGPFAQDTRRPSTVGTSTAAAAGRRSSAAAPTAASPGGTPASPLDGPITATEAAEAAAAAAGGVQVDAFSPTPPPLNYSLRDRKWAIAVFWTVIVFDSVAMPIALYFGLWYGVGPGASDPAMRRLSANTVFSIVTAALGGASILEYFVRFWRLWKKGSTCRVIDAHRWYLDWFHWNFSLAWIIIMIELIV
jgi:hypothetical protein